eukprot:1176401-Prorocentrum_minimum.AAC.2
MRAAAKGRKDGGRDGGARTARALCAPGMVRGGRLWEPDVARVALRHTRQALGLNTDIEPLFSRSTTGEFNSPP